MEENKIKHPLFPDSVNFMIKNGFDDEEIDDTLEPMYNQFFDCCYKLMNKNKEFTYFDYTNIVNLCNKTMAPTKIFMLNRMEYESNKIYINESLKRIKSDIDFKFV